MSKICGSLAKRLFRQAERRASAVKRLRKTCVALLCCLVLFLAVLPAAAGAQSMYFMVVNDHLLDYSADAMPFVEGATVYVPYTMFIQEENGGVDLGVYYGVSEKNNTLSLYTRSDPILTFDLSAGTTYNAAGSTYSFRAISRGGIIYVPAWAVCNYFGLQYSSVSTDYGVLIRVKKSGSYWLNDRFYVSSASTLLSAQKKQFDADQADQTAPATPSPSPSPSGQPTDKSHVRVSFAFRCDSGSGPGQVLDALEGSGVNALFLFRPEELSLWDEEVRRLLGEGHRVGLLVDGETAEECLAQTRRGSDLLARTAWVKTDFLLVDGSEELREALSGLGWACWKGNISGLPQEETRPASLSANIMLNVEAKRSYARILMDDSDTSAAALSLLLPQLTGGGYTFHTITELDLT